MSALWRLHFGIHNGTLASRDDDAPTTHVSEQEARAEFARAKKYFAAQGNHDESRAPA